MARLRRVITGGKRVNALRLNVDGLDYALLAIYFVTVLGIGWISPHARRPAASRPLRRSPPPDPVDVPSLALEHQ